MYERHTSHYALYPPQLRFKDSIGSKERIGRCLVPLKLVTAQQPEPYTHWYHLGEGSWGDDGGCVSVGYVIRDEEFNRVNNTSLCSHL